MPTVRTHNPDGSYKDVTTDAQGREIRTASYDADGELQERVEIDPETGKSETSTYADGELSATDRYDEFGTWTGGEQYDDKGRVLVRSKPHGDGGTRSEDYAWDDQGRMTKVTVTIDGSIVETVYFEYDDNGRLIRISRDRVDDGSTSEATVSEEGDVMSGSRDREELAEIARRLLLGEYHATGVHLTTELSGDRVRVRHNNNGTYDVEVRDAKGGLVLLAHLRTGRCYLADACPFRRQR